MTQTQEPVVAEGLRIRTVSLGVYRDADDDDGTMEVVPGTEGFGELTLFVPEEIVAQIDFNGLVDIVAHPADFIERFKESDRRARETMNSDQFKELFGYKVDELPDDENPWKS